MFKDKMLYTMWTRQVYWHHDKMAGTKTHRTSQNTEYIKTQHTLRNNHFLCFSDFSVTLKIQVNVNFMKSMSK